MKRGVESQKYFNNTKGKKEDPVIINLNEYELKYSKQHATSKVERCEKLRVDGGAELVIQRVYWMAIILEFEFEALKFRAYKDSDLV